MSHVNLDVINYAKDKHITLLSFPPHTSHHLQPLYKTVYHPIKSFFNAACDSWMREPQNAGKSMSIRAIPSVVICAFPKAFTTSNITAGFKATGIWPYDGHIFPPEAFLPSSTTDRPLLGQDSDQHQQVTTDRNEEDSHDETSDQGHPSHDCPTDGTQRVNATPLSLIHI